MKKPSSLLWSLLSPTPAPLVTKYKKYKAHTHTHTHTHTSHPVQHFSKPGLLSTWSHSHETLPRTVVHLRLVDLTLCNALARARRGGLRASAFDTYLATARGLAYS